MQFSWTIFTVVLLLGIVQLAAGVVFGRCLPLGRKKGRQTLRNITLKSRPGRLRRLVRGMLELLSQVFWNVDERRTEMERVNEEWSSIPPVSRADMPKSVLKTVAQIMEINERLQTRLSDAEVKLEQQAEQMESQVVQARTDALTGLPNRRAFDDEMVRRIAEWQRKNVTFCMLILDIDHFKRLNDRYGHPAGDYVLRHVAEVLATTLREMDLVARIGGEEFAVLLPSTGAAAARRTTERIRSAIASEVFYFEQMEIRLTVSLGLAAVAPQDDAVSLLKRADKALYAAKRGGRNCGYFHDGRTCTRIGLSPSGGVDPSTDAIVDGAASAKNTETAELATICDQLRNRLAEMVNES